MANMAEVTGIPISIIRQAKKSGVPGFDAGNRCWLYPVLAWFFQQDGKGFDSEDWANRFKRANALIKENELEIRNGKLIRFDLVKSVHAMAIPALFLALRKNARELPPVLKGLSEVEIQQRLEKENGMIEQRVREAFEKLKKETFE